MTLWAAYVPHGHEFALVEDCDALGIQAVAPRKVEALRTGNRRIPVPRVTPYLPNYVFVRASDQEWHWLKDIRYVRDLMGIVPKFERKVQAFVDEIERQYRERMDEIEQAQRIMRDADATKAQRKEALKAMAHYQPGDLLEVMTGPFAGFLAQFGRMVQSAASFEIEASVTIFGRDTTARFDPLTVKKAG